MDLPTEGEPVRLVCGDALRVLQALPDCSVDSVVTDPPAGIAFMGKEWDDARLWQAPISGFGLADSKFRLPAPTIGDARNPMCRTCRKHKRGSKKHQRCECDRPDYDEADRRLATRARFVGFLTAVMAECLRVLKPGGHALVWAIPRTSHWTGTACEDAGFEIRDRIGHLFGSGFPKSHNLPGGLGTALKPACEDWWLCRKPLVGTVASNVERFGTGALNIDGCRVPTDDPATDRDDEPTADKRYTEDGTTDFAAKPGKRRGRPLRVKMAGDSVNPGVGNLSDSVCVSGRAAGETTLGRWPANVTHDGSDEVLAGFPESDGQAGDVRGTEPSQTGDANCYGEYGRVPFAKRDDSGSAARFFYAAKASREDRDEGLDGPLKPLLWSSGEQSPGTFQSEGTVRAARNNHPTVKPVALMRWLCRLITPPGGIVLDCFCGSGSTGKAAAIEGFRFIGIDQSREYLEIAAGRIHHAHGAGTMFATDRPEVIDLTRPA